MQREPHKEKTKLVERYFASFRPIEDALHLALLEIGDAAESGKNYIGHVWRLIAVNEEKTATFVSVEHESQNLPILEQVPNGRLKLFSLLENDELTIQSLRIPDFSLFGLPGILRLVDVHRLKQIFNLCRRVLITASSFQICSENDKDATGVVNVATSIFGDAALNRNINPHPSVLHIYRVFVASATNITSIDDKKTQANLIDGLVTCLSNEIHGLKLTGSSPETTDALFGISLSSQMATSFDISAPFLFLDRFLTLENIKTFVNNVIFSLDARSSDEAELVLNCFIVNDFENMENGITDLPHVFAAYIHYSWAIVKPSSSNEVLSTVLHGGGPPLSLLFSSVFDDLAALQSYLRLFDSPQCVNSIIFANDVLVLRQYYQEKLAYFAASRSFDNLFDLSMSLLAYGCTIIPPILDRNIDSSGQNQLIESVAKLFSSNASAFRALVNYGLALGLCGSRFVGSIEVTATGNGRWYALACQNFADRIKGFYGVDKIHYRTIPTADSGPLANILLTTAAAISPMSELENLPICPTALPNIIAGITTYAQVYWFAVATASALSNCHYLLSTISNLRNYKSSGGLSHSEMETPLSIHQVVAKFIDNSDEKRQLVLGRETSASYLRGLMRNGQFHDDYCEITQEMLVDTLGSTSLGDSPDARNQAPNDWLAIGARLAKFASARNFSLINDNSRSASTRHNKKLTLGAFPAVSHHLAHCKGCCSFSHHILKVLSFINPRNNFPQCFRPVLALSGPSALRCFYQSQQLATAMTPILLTQFWLPNVIDGELVAAPLDSIAEAMSHYLSSLFTQNTVVHLLSFRFVVLNNMTAFEEEDFSCYETPPVDVALPVAFRDVCGCAAELHRWWSVSPRHRVLLRGIVDISEPPKSGILSKRNYNPCFVEFFVDIRPCYTSDFATAIHPFDRLNNIFASVEDYDHFEASLIHLASANDSTVIGIENLENAMSMSLFFNYPMLPFALRQVDIDIHCRYTVAMASSNWYEASLLAHWHSIILPVGDDKWNCILMDAEAVFRQSLMMAPLLRLPSWLKGLSSLALYCRDSLLMQVNFSTGTTSVGTPALGPLSSFHNPNPRNESSPAITESSDFCNFEMGLLHILGQNVKSAGDLAASRRSSEPDIVFANEPTGYSSVVWAVASNYINHAWYCVQPEERPSNDPKVKWQHLIDRFCTAGNDLAKLAALLLGYCDTISYYNLFAFSKKHQMIKRVSFSCVADDPYSEDSFDECPAPPRGIFRQDVVALTRTPVFE